MNYTVLEKAPQAFAKEIKTHPVIATILWNRGVRTPEEADRFLRPVWERDTHDPFLFSNMQKAVQRIFDAIDRHERIVIHGDYDADGVTGSSVLFETLKALGTIAEVYIPHREHEGYGLRMATVDALKAAETKLIITVDCGIASVAETDHAHALGIDTIVVDHHAMPPELSKTSIIIHPHVPGETYPFKPLAAVGVAYKLASALIIEAGKRGKDIPMGFSKWLLDFVAIATVTDVVPLIGENRVLEKYGLMVMQKTRRPGFRALYRVAGVDPLSIDTQTIGFAIGPRINAAGRMKHAKLAFEALTATDPVEADLLAAELQAANTERQKETEKMVQIALEKAKSQASEKVICLAHEGWPHGLVGLVASRIVNTYQLPAYVVGITERGLVGSGRSIPGFHITDALRPFSEHLSRFGGHPQACGFTVKALDSLDALFDGLRSHARSLLQAHSTEKQYTVDAELAPQECTIELAEQLQALEPHGEGNPRPVLIVKDVPVQTFTLMGKDQNHLKINRNIVAFKMGERAKELALNVRIDVIGELSVNEWNGRRKPQVIARDFQVKK